MPEIVLDDTLVSYRVRRSHRVRSSRVVSHPWLGLEVVVPARARAGEVERTLRACAPFALREAARLPALQPLGPGTAIVVRGRPRVLHVRPAARVSARLAADGSLEVGAPVPSEDVLRRALERLLRREARVDLEVACDRYESRLAVRRTSLAVRDTRSRYGSCSAAGVLSFSWRLVLAPPPVLDYVAAHEVAHLRERGHGSRFWRVVRELEPDFADARAWLRRNGAALRF